MSRTVGFLVLAFVMTGCASTGPEQLPCADPGPLGCSIPPAIRALIEDYDEQADKFHRACVLHDLCYRHGAATYDLSREACDAEFYDNMKSACKGAAGLGVLDPEDFAKCRFAALQTYEAVREHGEEHFRSATSSYCEYRSDP